MARDHYLREAFFDGLRIVDIDDMLQQVADHTTVKGEWDTGVVSPSLVATECRLSRLKQFLGDDPQPGLKRLTVRGGHPDAVTHLNFLRGFTMEGVVVTALKHALGAEYIYGNAPSLVFKWKYKGDDIQLSMWNQGMVFAGHPDVLLFNQNNELELVQIKSPSIFKFERMNRLGDEDALKSYRAQMATEMYIGRRMGFPIRRSHLMMVSWEGTPKIDDPHCRIVTMGWSEDLATIPEQVARDLIHDYDQAYTLGLWPEPYEEHKASTFPCLYCRYARLSSFDTIGCTEQQEWERHAETGVTRITAPPPDFEQAKNILAMKRRRRSA
jgi:hypothetical protein